MSSDTSYNLYDKITSIDWNGQHFILTARGEITDNSFAYAYSSDGISWTKSQFGPNITTTNPYAAKFIGDKFIVSGNLVSSSLDASGNTIAKNCMMDIIDGQFQVPITTNLNSNTVVYDIEQNLEHPHQIVFPKNCTLSLGSSIKYSLDQGQTWSVTTSPFSGAAMDAVWNGKIWVSVGSGANTIATSLDGIRWIGRGNYIFSTSCNGVDWSPSQKKYVAVGSGTNVVATSMDGIYWLPTNTSLFSAGGNDVKWGGGLWVTVGTVDVGTGSTIAYSYDAISWQYSANSFSTSASRIYYDSESAKWTIYGSDPSFNIGTSNDGIHWQLSYIAGANALALDIERGQFADPSLNLYPGIPYPLYITDVSGINTFAHNHCDKGCAYIQPISIGCGSGANSIAISTDGIQWSAIPNSIFSSCNKATWNGKLWVIVGAKGTHWVATSCDGYEWTGRNAALMTECYDVAWNGTCFVAVGQNGGASSLATSLDGIVWTSVSISSIFSSRIHAIEWTGAVWLAYGSGTNTTAISSSVDASLWTPTPTPNVCVVDCSNITTAAISVTASSYQDPNVPANVVDGSFNSTITKWYSSASNYDVSGNYIGSSITSGISGEWLQIQLSSSLSSRNYYVVVCVADASAIPKTWSLLGSNDASSWSVLDTFYYGAASPPNNNWKYPFICLPLDISAGLVAAYSYYRIVFTSNYGAGYVSVAEVALFDGGAKQLDQYIRPIVLKDYILHPTRLLSIGSGSIPNIYRITDLSCNIIRTGIIHSGTYVNNTLYGLSEEPVAAIFDGENHVVFSISGEVAYLSNTASNTHLNFDNSMNGTAISGLSGGLYAACYNRKFILAGSFYVVFNEYISPQFYPNNLSSLFTSIKGLASNSGYGFVVSPNTIYLQSDERLSLVTPKFYDSTLMSDTSISFNVYKADNNT